MQSDPFDVLGVDPAASEDEIRVAYLRLARQLHPDRHPGVGPAERERLTTAMARVNEAWDVLSDPDERRRLRRRRTADGSSPGPRQRPPGPQECTLCGSSPARYFRFTHQSAFVFRAVLYGTEAVLCRTCARALGRLHQNRTLWRGWWGVLSFFRNLLVVTRNTVGLVRAALLARPSPPDDEVAAPLPFPLPDGRPVWLRSGVWMVAAAVTVFAIYAATTDPEPSPPVDFSLETWRVGACVAEDSAIFVYPVPCGDEHDGEITRKTSSPLRCPTDTDGYVRDGITVWCIDTDR